MKLYIPKKLKIGFQNRKEASSGKLAYIIYYDDKNVLKKEHSWEKWRDKTLGSIDVDNIPRTGLIIDRSGGGCRYSDRVAFIRMYDPQGFDFEISASNLIFLIKHCSYDKDNGFSGEFVYAWDGTKLVVLPTNSEEYKESTEFTRLKSCSITKKDLIAGGSYKSKDGKELFYIGRRDKNVIMPNYYDKCLKKAYTFYDGNDFLFYKDLKHIAEFLNCDKLSKYDEVVDLYHKSKYTGVPVKLFLKESDDKNCSFVENNNVYDCYRYGYLRYSCYLKNNELVVDHTNAYSNTGLFKFSITYDLYALLDNGCEVKIV